MDRLRYVMRRRRVMTVEVAIGVHGLSIPSAVLNHGAINACSWALRTMGRLSNGANNVIIGLSCEWNGYIVRVGNTHSVDVSLGRAVTSSEMLQPS